MKAFLVCLLLLSAVLVGDMFAQKIFWSTMWGYPSPLKVTDPADPRFDPYSFKLDDYRDYYYRAYVLSNVLSKGMLVEEVDKILVKSAGMKRGSVDNGVARYTKSTSVFDPGVTVIQCYFSSVGELYQLSYGSLVLNLE